MSLRLWLAVGGVATLFVLISAIYLQGRGHGVDVERGKTTAALAQAERAAVEADLARQAAARVDVVVHRQAEASEAAYRYSTEAVKAEDANAPLSSDRTARLRSADRELCQLTPTLEGCISSR